MQSTTRQMIKHWGFPDDACTYLHNGYKDVINIDYIAAFLKRIKYTKHSMHSNFLWSVKFQYRYLSWLVSESMLNRLEIPWHVVLARL